MEKGRKTADISALFGALCFLGSTIEYLIPKPLPFLRLGIANAPLVLALGILPAKAFFYLAFIKVLGQALLSGTLFSFIFLFSFTGTMCSCLAMFTLHRLLKHRIGDAGLCTAGALFSNAAQLLLAGKSAFGEQVLIIAPVFLAVGTVTSFFLGICISYFKLHSIWYEKISDPDSTGGIISLPEKSDSPFNSVFTKKDYFIIFFCFLVWCTLLLQNLTARAVSFIISFLLVLKAGKKIRVSAVITFLIIVLFNLILPSGRIIFQLGNFAVTETALKDGLGKAFLFEGSCFISSFLLNRNYFSLKKNNLINQSLALFALMQDSFKSKEKVTLKDFNPMKIVLAIDERLLSVSGWNTQKK